MFSENVGNCTAETETIRELAQPKNWGLPKHEFLSKILKNEDSKMYSCHFWLKNSKDLMDPILLVDLGIIWTPY